MGLRIRVGFVLLAGLMGATSTVGFAQTAPPGAAAPVPVLPASNTPPPATSVPAALSDVPVQPVVFSYFGPYAVVDELMLPQRVRSSSTVSCWSAPNATSEDQTGVIDFGPKPAGTEFIAFFARGSRLYVFDTSYGNYCWVDNDVTRA
jgi:hypothetical protein